MSQLLGYSEDELLAMNPLDLLNGESKKKFQEIVKEALTGKKTLFQAEFEVRTKNGQPIWVLLNAKVNFNNGKPDTVQVFAQDITKLKKTEKECKEVEERFRGLVESTSDWIWQVDQNVVYTYASPKTMDVLGYSPEEVLGKTPFDLMPEEEAKRIVNELREIVRQKIPFQGLENWNIHKNGTLVLLETSGVPILDDKGRLIGYRGIDRDITERKRVEEALRLSEEKFLKAFQNSPIAVTLTRLSDGAIADANNAAISLFGFQRKEVIGKSTLELKLWPYKDERVKLVGKLSSEGSVRNQEFTLRKKDGSQFQVNLSASAIKIQGEKHLLSTFIDITEPKKAEALLEETKVRLQNILDAMDDGIVLIDLGGKVLDCNKAMLKQLGFAREEIIDKSITDFIFLEDGQNALMETSSKVQQTGKTLIEVRALKKDKSVFPAEISITAFYDKNRNPVALLGVARDITERKKVEEELKKSEELYRTLFDNSEDGFILLEPLYDESGEVFDFRFVKVNRAYERQTERKLAVVEGKNAKEVAPELEKEWVAAIDNVVKTNKSIRYENYNKRTSKWYDAHFFPFAKNQVGVLFRDITKRKKAEQNLKKTQGELKTIFDSSPSIIFYKNREGRVIQANEAFAEALDVPKDKLLGKTVFDLYSNEIAQNMTNDDLIVMKSKRPKLDIIESYESPTGLRWMRTDKIPILDENGAVNGIIGFSEDITERKKSREALKESEERLMMAQQVARVGTFELNIQTGVNKWTPELEDMYGLPPGGFRGTQEAWEQLVHYEDRPEVVRRVSEALYKGGFEGEWRVVWPDGSTHWLFGRAWVFKDANGKPLRLIGINIDITERKKAEEALRQSEERFSKAFHSNPTAMTIARLPDGMWIDANESFLRLTGYSRKEVIGHSSSELNLFVSNPTERNHIISLLQTQGNVNNFEINAKTKTGEPLQLLLSAVKTVLNGQEYAITTQIDITEHKKLEKQVIDSERLATIGATAGMVGHDIRNPLQAVMSDTYLLKDELASMPECKNKENLAESIDSIERNVVYINKIVQDLQDYARPVEPEYAIVDLSDVLVRVFETVSVPEVIKLSIHIKDVEKVIVDPTLLQRAITNLVNNAIQAMPEGGKLEITGNRTGSKIVVTVSDTGVGIPEEIKPKLFTPMITTKAKGQGFGLAVSKRLIESLKGTISFESEISKGTKFIIKLPANQQ